MRAQNFGEEGGVGAINGRAVWAGAVYGGDNKIAIDTTARGRDRGGRVGGVTRGEGRAAAGTRKHFFTRRAQQSFVSHRLAFEPLKV